MGTTMIFILYVNIKAIIKGMPIAKWILSAMVFIIFSFVFDAMVYSGAIESRISMSAISSLIFVLLVTAGTFRVYSKAFDTVEKQGDELLVRLSEVEKLNDEKIMTLEVKDEFLKRTSHEMKSPLNGIIGMTEMMIEGETGHLSQSAINQLAIISYSSKRMNNMINNVIDASKIKLNELDVIEKPVNIAGVLEVVKILSESELKKMGIELTLDLPENVSVLGDEDKINQIFHNLVDNSVRHSQGNIIEVSHRETEGEFEEIVLKDNGIGIKKENFQRIFERYESTNSTSSGLGLYISRGLSRLHGGDVTVEESKEGNGVRFIVKLKKSEIPADKPLTERIIKENRHLMLKKDDLEENGNGLKLYEIWAVDDDSMNLEIVVQVLGKYNVRTFERAEDILEEMKIKKPDLLLADIMMPGMNGYELCKEVRKRYNHLELPLIFLTGLSDSRNIVSGYDIGGNDFIIKPIDPNVMRVRVRSQLSLSLVAKRWVNLRGYSNKISEFKNTRNMINAVFDLLQSEGAVSDIGVFEGGRKIKKLSDTNSMVLKEFYNSDADSEKDEVFKIKRNGKDYILLNFMSMTDVIMVVEFIYEPDIIDLEYLGNAVDQIKATKRNLASIMSQTKEISIINEINKRLTQIRYIKAHGNYSVIHYKTPGGKKKKEKEMRISFNSIRLFMGDDPLLQIHKGTMINKNYVRLLLKRSRKSDMKLDVDGEIMTVGRSFIKNVELMTKEIKDTISDWKPPKV